MKKGFVQTENYKRLKEAERIVARRGAREAGLVVVRGAYGVGKSELTERWAADSRYLFVRAKETWTKGGMLRELAALVGVPAHGVMQEVEARIIGRLATSMVPLIVDEADFLIRGHGVRSSAVLLEVLRDITDLTGCMCFLVGMERFPERLAWHEHIASRVARTVEFEPLSLADVQATIAAKAEVPFEADVAPEVLRQARGRMRLVLTAIATIEEWARANGWAKVALEHVAGRPLCPEFNARELGRRAGQGASAGARA